MSLFLAVNRGGLQAITPTSFSTADELTVTIDGTAYAVTGTGAANTTIDAWISAHAEVVSKNHGVYAADGATVINLYNVDVLRTLAATNGTVGSRSEITNAGTISLRDSTFVLSGSTVTVYLNEDINDNYDEAAFAFASANEAVRGLEALDDFLRNGNRVTANAQAIDVPFFATFG